MNTKHKIIPVLAVFFALITASLFGQTEKTVEIYRKSEVIMNARLSDDGVSIHFTAYDSRYRSLIEAITIYSGEPQGCYAFLSEVELFCNQNQPGTTTTIDNRTVRLKKFFGSIEVDIYEQDNGAGYHTFKPKQISQFREKLGDWIRAAEAEKTGYVTDSK